MPLCERAAKELKEGIKLCQNSLYGGSGHFNCWHPLPISLGEYEADTFIEACYKACEHLCGNWTFTVVDGALYIESNELAMPFMKNRLGKFGFFQTEEDAMQETLRRFDRDNMDEYMRTMNHETEPTELKCWERLAIPQLMYDSLQQPFYGNMCLRRNQGLARYDVLVRYDIEDIKEITDTDEMRHLSAQSDISILNMCMNCPMRNQ